MKAALQHIVDWTNGEAYFAITLGSRIVRRLPDRLTESERRAAYREYVKSWRAQ